MIHLLKKGLALLAVLSISVVLLAAYMSSSNLSKESHTEVIDYSESIESRDSTLKVMTFNIGYLSGMTNNLSIHRESQFFADQLMQAKNLIKVANANVVSFQEIDFGASRSFHVDQLDSIASAGKFVSGYKSINWDKKYVPFPYWPPSNHFGQMLSGQAILSRYPIETDTTIILNPNLSAPAYYRAFYLNRLLQIAEINFRGSQVKIMNVHLEAFDKKTRLKQLEIVKREFEKYASQQPVLLMGDFNSEVPDRSAERDAIDLLMEAKWITSAIPFDQELENRTFSSEHPVRMIDYIFYNKNYFRCIDAKVLNEAGPISDHLPLWAELETR
ncbi:endonuclease/exonuclease/phosphatase family protein [Ekhidna sp.]